MCCYSETSSDLYAESSPAQREGGLLLFHKHVVQAANVGKDLNDELITVVEGELRVAAPADTARRSRDAVVPEVSSCLGWVP